MSATEDPRQTARRIVAEVLASHEPPAPPRRVSDAVLDVEVIDVADLERQDAQGSDPASTPEVEPGSPRAVARRIVADVLRSEAARRPVAPAPVPRPAVASTPSGDDVTVHTSDASAETGEEPPGPGRPEEEEAPADPEEGATEAVEGTTDPQAPAPPPAGDPIPEAVPAEDASAERIPEAVPAGKAPAEVPSEEDPTDFMPREHVTGGGARAREGAVATETGRPTPKVEEPLVPASSVPPPTAGVPATAPEGAPERPRQEPVRRAWSHPVDELAEPEPEVVEPDVMGEPPRTGRWLLVTVLGALALAWLFPLAVAALRELVAL